MSDKTPPRQRQRADAHIQAHWRNIQNSETENWPLSADSGRADVDLLSYSMTHAGPIRSRGKWRGQTSNI